MTHSVRLTFLGCGDAFGSGGRLNTCFYVDAPSARFLIDCGATSLVALHRRNLTSDDVDVILITHFHGDHYGGLPFLFLDAAKQRKRQRPLTVVTPPGGEERTRDLMERLYPGTSGAMDELDLRFVYYNAHERLEAGSLSVTAHPVIHSPAALSHGLRIAVDGREIGFSGDTEWTDELLRIADGAHLMICECNFYDTRIPGHLDYVTLARHVHEFAADRIVLNHLGDEMLARRDQVELTCAEEGMELTV
jgi:ribonuclease BN (tRNA processing enzyme)